MGHATTTQQAKKQSMRRLQLHWLKRVSTPLPQAVRHRVAASAACKVPSLHAAPDIPRNTVKKVHDCYLRALSHLHNSAGPSIAHKQNGWSCLFETESACKRSTLASQSFYGIISPWSEQSTSNCVSGFAHVKLVYPFRLYSTCWTPSCLPYGKL